MKGIELSMYYLFVFAVAAIFALGVFKKLGLNLNIFDMFSNCNHNCICESGEKTCGDCMYDFSSKEICKNLGAINYIKSNLCLNSVCYSVCEDAYNDILTYYWEQNTSKNLYEDALMRYNESHCCLLLVRIPPVLKNEGYYCDKNGYLRS